MPTRNRIASLVLAAASGAFALAAPAQETGKLGSPPGARLATLPRQPVDKPQEVSVAVSPRDPRNVIVSYHQAVDEGSDHHPNVRVHANVAWSADGGQTWNVAPGTTHERYRRSLDAAVTFDLHGHAFLVYLAMDEISLTTRHGQFLRRSLDGGRTWSAPIALAELPGNQDPVLEHFPNIVADNHASSPHVGSVYVIWDRILDGNKIEMILVRSTDDGKTWSSPAVIARYPARVEHSVAVGPDGTLYIAYSYVTDGDEQIAFSTSQDGGLTFGPWQPLFRAKGKPKEAGRWAALDFPRAFGMPLVGSDARGRLYLVWGDYRNGDSDIMAATSEDKGRTWTSPVRVNNDPKSNGKDQVMHWMTVDPADGAAYVLFYDRRNDPNNKLPTITLARSSDGGKTFANYAWSDKPADPTQASIGDYIGLAAHSGRVYGAWTEHVPGAPSAAAKVPKAQPKSQPPGKYHDWPSGPSAVRVGIAEFRER